MQDFIFGTLSTLEKRVNRSLEQIRGLRHNNRIEPIAPRAGDAPMVSVLLKSDRPVQKIICRVTEPVQVEIEMRPSGTEWDLLDWSYYQVWSATLPAQPDGTLVWYEIEGVDFDAEVVQAECPRFAYYVGDPAAPEWTKSAVIYQVFPDRFDNDDGTLPDLIDPNEIFGGTLRGVINRLDYIADLGFNAIWINPFFPDHTHHGYHATDYFTVNPRLGTMDDIRELIAEAHKRGMRMILDFVANHWGSGHETFQEAIRNRDSKYHDWYRWNKWPEEYESFFGVEDLPQVNVDFKPARDYLLKSADFWLREMDFDGYRLDYAVGPSHAFWAAFRATCKAAKPDAWIYGEVVEDPGSQASYVGRLDGCIDFLVADNLRRTFAWGSKNFVEFDHFLNQHMAWMPDEYSRPSFLDNHDMDRFSFVAGGDVRRLKMAALCQFTLPGIPIVYYGTEVGVEQIRPMHTPDSWGMAECRRPMLWGAKQDTELHEFYRWLIHFRRRHPVLHNGTRQTVHLAEKTWAYTVSDDAESILVAFNMSDEAQTVALADRVIELEAMTGTAIELTEQA